MKLIWIAAAAMLAACGLTAPSTTTTSEGEPAPAPGPATPTQPDEPKKPDGPELGAWGFDSAGMDKSVSPGTSFYNYANGTWLKNTPLPPDKSNYGMFTALADRSDERTRAIVESASGEPGSEGQKIRDYYQSFMDEKSIEAKGIAPLQPRLDQITAIQDVSGLVAAFAASSRELNTSPLATIVQQDDRKPDQHIANIRQGGLGLPDRDMYDAKRKQFAPVREGYKKYLRDMLALSGAQDADKRAAAVYALEEKIAGAHWTRVQNRDAQKTYNKMTIAQLERKAPGIDWKAWLEGVGLTGQTEVNVNQPSAITKIAA